MSTKGPWKANGRNLVLKSLVDRMRKSLVALGVVLAIVGAVIALVPVTRPYEVEVPYTIEVPQKEAAVDHRLDANVGLGDGIVLYWEDIPVISGSWATVDLSSSEVIEVTITGADGKRIYHESGKDFSDTVDFNVDDVIRVDIVNPLGPGAGKEAVIKGDIVIAHYEIVYVTETRYSTETEYETEHPFEVVGDPIFLVGIFLAGYGARSRPKPQEVKPPVAPVSCPHCGAPVPTEAEYCIACGRKIR